MGFMKGFRGSAIERVMFTFFVLIMLAFLIKTISQCESKESEEPKVLQPISKEEVIQHGYDDPADFANDTTVSELRRMYFKKVFHYDDEHKR